MEEYLREVAATLKELEEELEATAWQHFEMRDQGVFLVRTNRPRTILWGLSDGTVLSDGAARLVISNPDVGATDFGLLEDMPQRWRWTGNP